jgi:hypothetical protein
MTGMVEKVSCKFGIGSFLGLCWYRTQKFKFLRLLKSDQPRISAVRPTSKSCNSQIAYRIEACE